MKVKYIECGCTDMGCTIRVSADPDPDWQILWFEYYLNIHHPWWRRLALSFRYLFNMPVCRGHFGGTVVKNEDVMPLIEFLKEYHTEVYSARQ